MAQGLGDVNHIVNLIHKFFMTFPNPLSLKKRSSPYVWVTWLTAYLSGESQCKFALWNLCNFRVPPNDEMLSDWLVQHQSLLSEVAHNLRSEGFQVEEENANSLSLMTSVGITISGKPDIITSNGQGMVVDVKTGKPRGKDRAQINLYQALIPAQKKHGITEVPWGRIVYGNGEVKLIPPSEVDDAFKNSVKGLIHMVAQPVVPDPQPSLSECHFCKCNKICPSVQTEMPETQESLAWV
jgi:CRISPR/Cas system-associated exonuclease Cas4 (RecB family)